ncbi:MAG TPA: hypothetical protein VE959_02370 [Bryobacteraceae bacterium]|nr:hypothetical protein [Bryobacteraceae bacterium]
MERDFRKGHIAIDFPTVPFDSVGGLLLRSTRLFFATLPFLAAVTLVVMVPGKLLLEFTCYVTNVPSEGVLSYLLMDMGDLVFGALVMPAAIYGLVMKLRTGKTAPTGESLRWGRRLWGKSLWNMFKVEVTIMLWSLLLVIPGIVAAIRLIFVDPVVAIEGRPSSEILERSRQLCAGHGWRILVALLPAVPINLLHLLASLRALQYSRWLMPPVDGLFAVAEHWMTAVVVLMYLGLAAR